jgi:hypothetical protein
LVPLWFDELGPDFVVAGPDLLPGLPATPAPLFVFDCAIAIDEASIAASTIAIVLRIAFPLRYQWTCGIECRVFGQRCTRPLVPVNSLKGLAPASSQYWKGGPGLRRLECASVKRPRIHSSLLTSKEPPRSASGVDMASIDRMRVPALPDDTHRGVIKICGVAVKAPQFAYTRFPHQPT